MAFYHANYVDVLSDIDYGEGEIVFRWPDSLYGYEELRIDLDGHCSRRMPIHSGSGPPDFVALHRDRISLRFNPPLAEKLQLEEQIEITFEISDADFRELRRVFNYFNGIEDDRSRPAKR